MMIEQEKNKNLEFSTLIWLDKHVYEQQKQQVSTGPTREQLRSIINYMEVFDQLDACQHYIENVDKQEEIVLIVSGTYAMEILPKIHDQIQLRSVYIYCMNKQEYQNWVKQFPKICGIFNDSDRLLTQLTHDQKYATKSSMIPLTFFSRNKDLSKQMQQQRILTKQNGEFLWFQILIELMSKKTVDDDENHEGIKNLVDGLRQYFQSNEVQLQKIKDFETDYEAEHAIWWYSKEPFFYSVINKALRTYDYDTIILFRTFINDMYQFLKDRYNEQKNNNKTFQVYRGQAISFEELEQIKKNKGEFLSFNNFLSTTRTRENGLFFTDASGAQKHGLYPILFELKVNASETTKPYVDISGFSQFNTEEEILFMIGTICRIDNVFYNNTESIWIVQLTLMNENNYELYDVFESLKKRKISDYSLINLANIFEEMGEYEKAEKILHQRLSKLSIEQMNEKYNCYDLLGTLAGRNGHFQQAIKYHLQSIQLQKQILPIDQKQLALTYNNLGSSYGMNGQFDSALSNLFESEKIISELFNDQNHLLFAGTYENIANCYFNQNKFDKAQEYFQRAFDIRQYNNIPENSPEYIEYYMSVGNIFGSNKQFHEAVNYHRKAIEIVQRVYPSDHQLLAFCCNNLGKDYGDQKQYQLAKENYQQALNIYQQILSNDHPEMIRTQENIDELYMDMWTEVGKLLLITVIIMLSIVFFFFI